MTFRPQSSPGGFVLLAAVIALGGLTPVFGQAAVAKAPVPDAAAQGKALKLIAEIFEQQWTGAKTTAQKTALAQKMIEQAARTADDPAGQFTLLRVARDIAAQSGDVTTAFAAIEMLDRGFHIDAVKMKTDALLMAAKSIVRAEDAKVAGEESVALVRAAIAQDDYPTAEQLLRVGQSSARKSRDAELIRDLTDLGRGMKRITRAYEAVQPALRVLDEKPTDPAANLSVGRFYCFVKGDWQLGVSMLALADNTPYQTPARKELEEVSSLERQVALGDAWWDLGQQADASEQEALLGRAGVWYERALPQLRPGLTKAKVEKRLDEVAALQDNSGSMLLAPVEPGGKVPPGIWVDLLKWVDVDKDRVRGTWRPTDQGLVVTPQTWSSLMLPIRVQGGYDLEFEFTRTTGIDTVCFPLPAGPESPTLSFSILGGRFHALEGIEHRSVHEGNPTNVTPGTLVNNRKYNVRVSFRLDDKNARFQVWANGTPFIAWSGKLEAVGAGWPMPDKSRPALAAYNVTATFHTARIRIVSGKATRVARD